MAIANGTRALPQVRIRGKVYFVDAALQQFRNVENPHDWLTFDQVDADDSLGDEDIELVAPQGGLDADDAEAD